VPALAELPMTLTLSVALIAGGIDLDALEGEIAAAAVKLQSAASLDPCIGIDDVLAADRHRLSGKRDAVGGIERRVAARKERAAALDGAAGDGKAASGCDQAGIVEIADIIRSRFKADDLSQSRCSAGQLTSPSESSATSYILSR